MLAIKKIKISLEKYAQVINRLLRNVQDYLKKKHLPVHITRASELKPLAKYFPGIISQPRWLCIHSVCHLLIVSGDGLSPVRHQAIAGTNADLLSRVSAESQSRSQSGIKLAMKWTTSQKIKFDMKLSPMVRGIYTLNLRTQHTLVIFIFNRDMFVGGTYTSYQYTSRGNYALVYHAICYFIKFSGFILSQVPYNNF